MEEITKQAPTEQTQEATLSESQEKKQENNSDAVGEQQKANDPIALERKNRELLGLLKKYKSELSEIKKVLEETKQSELEKQGRYADLYKNAKEEAERLRKQIEEERERNKLEKVKAKIVMRAVEKGAIDADLIFKLIDKDELLTLTDEEGESDTLIESILNMAQQRTKVPLFRKGVPAKVGAMSFTNSVSNSSSDLKKMSLVELKEIYKKTK